MRILAIDSSTRYSVAGLFNCTCDLSVDYDNFLSSLFLSKETDSNSKTNFEPLGIFSSADDAPDVNSSSSLVPGIRDLFHAADTKAADIDLLTITIGPGSFTGLRLGIVTAKTLAFAAGCNLVSVNVADAIACQSLQYAFDNQYRQLSIGIDIGRRELLSFEYQIDSSSYKLQSDPTIQSPNDWYQSIKSSSMLATGSGIKWLDQNQQESVNLAPVPMRHPTIETIAKVGLLNFKKSGVEDFWKLEPYYSRPSAAEEKLSK